MQKICVLIPCYKPSKKFLWESISSLEFASFQHNVEISILIGLDGEPDPEIHLILEVLKKKCRKSKLNFIIFPKVGIVGTLNSLIKLADCDFIARQDCDDMSLPMRFKIALDFMNSHSEVSFIGTQTIRINEFSQPLWFQKTYPTKMLHQMIYSSIYNNPISHPTLFLRRSVFDSAIQYRNVCGAEDWHLYNDLWFRGHKSYSLNNTSLLYRIHSGQLTKKLLSKEIRKAEQNYTLEALKIAYPSIYNRYYYFLKFLSRTNPLSYPNFLSVLHKMLSK